MIPVLFLFWFAFVSGIVLVLDKRKSTKSNPKKKKKKTNLVGFPVLELLTVPTSRCWWPDEYSSFPNEYSRRRGYPC